MSISTDLARRILEASKRHADELRSPVSIAIVDAGGHLVLLERMMAPYGWATVDISIAKATTAVMFNQSTDVIAQWGSSISGFASSMAAMTQGKFIMAAGGWPIRLSGATVGGIGVSGGNAPGRDDDIARAGLAAVFAVDPARVGLAEVIAQDRSGSFPHPIPDSARPPVQPMMPSYPPMSQPEGVQQGFTRSMPIQPKTPASRAITRQFPPLQEDSSSNQPSEHVPGGQS